MTAKIITLMKKDPPKTPIRDLKTLVADWKYRFGKKGAQRHMRDEVVDYCASAKDVEEAVDRACASRRPNGKMHNHQSKVKEADRKFFARRIKSMVDFASVLSAPEPFDALHDWLEDIKPPGIGPVTIYDVATRIGGFLKIEPSSLYLHAHVRVAYSKLYGTRRVPEVEGRVPRAMLPKELQKLPADEVEDMLCCYCDVIQPWLSNPVRSVMEGVKEEVRNSPEMKMLKKVILRGKKNELPAKRPQSNERLRKAAKQNQRRAKGGGQKGRKQKGTLVPSH